MTNENLFEKISCINCDSTDYKIIYPANYNQCNTKEELLKIYSSSSDCKLLDQLVCCTKCSLVYLNPRVKSDIIMSSYQEAIDPTFIEQNHYRIFTFKQSFQKIIKTFSLIPSKSTKILDIGCAGGAFPKVIKDLGFDIIGIEPSTWLVQQGKKKYDIDIRQGTLNNNSFPQNTFDVVTLWDVIEHITNPGLTLIKIYDILKKDGLLIINYPAYDSTPRRILRQKWPFFLSVHLFYFTSKTLTSYLTKHGFEVIKKSRYYQTLPLGYVLKRASAYFSIFVLFEKIAKYLKINNLPITYYMGQKMIIARKNGLK